jgi:acyl carrier protein
MNMNINEFIIFFKSIFDNELSEELTPETEFRYLDEWSSLTALSFITKCQDELGKNVSPIEMKKAETIEELYSLLISIQ